MGLCVSLPLRLRLAYNYYLYALFCFRLSSRFGQVSVHISLINLHMTSPIVCMFRRKKKQINRYPFLSKPSISVEAILNSVFFGCGGDFLCMTKLIVEPVTIVL